MLFVDSGCGLEDDSNTIETSQELISSFLLVSKEKGTVSALSWAISVNIIIIDGCGFIIDGCGFIIDGCGFIIISLVTRGV